MKNKNKIIPLLTLVGTTSIVVPLVSSCSKTTTLPTPGTVTTYDEALKWVKSYSQVTKSGLRIIRKNLAKTVDFSLSTSKLIMDGTGVSTHYEKKTGKDEWYPVTKLNTVQLNIKDRIDLPLSLDNERAAFSAVDVLSLNDKVITAEAPSYDRLCDFIFNPFLYQATFEEIHKLSAYNPAAFEEIFTSTSDTMYITYKLNDIEKLLATKEVADLLKSNTPCFIPFRGQGSMKISFGFNKYGYMTYGNFEANSDYLEIYTSPTSGKYPLRPVYFGKAQGNLGYEAMISYFNVPRISCYVDGSELAQPENRKDGTPTSIQWVNPLAEEFVEGDEYYLGFKDQSYKVLPGYGATVVLTGPQNWNITNVEFTIGNTVYKYSDIGPGGSGEVVMSSYYNDAPYKNAHTYVFYLKAPTFDLCNGNKFEIRVSTK